MSIKKGSIVFAKAGRDKGNFFVVIECDERFAYIADGRRRKIETPKKKSKIHLCETSSIFDGSIETNPQIKRILNQFIKNGG